MPGIPAYIISLILNILFCSTIAAQNSFKDREAALLYVANTLKPVASISYEGSAQLKHLYAMYVEDERLVYVQATQYDTTYTIMPYEAIEFADTGNLPKRYLNLYSAFGAFTKYSKKSNQSTAISVLGILMQDTAIYNPRRLVQAFDYLVKKDAGAVKQSFSNPDFFRLRAYQQFPNYTLQDSTGKEVFLNDIIKKAKKPAIIFTWAEWCPPCIKLFDSLVQNNIHKDYSLVLIKKGSKENKGKKYSLPKNFRWWEQVIFLFDKESVTDTLDNGSVPLVFWTDAGGTVIREHSGFNVSVMNIRQILDAINRQKLKPGPRFYDFFDTPVVSEAEARFKYVTERNGNTVKLLVYFRKLERFELKGTVNYKMNALGELQMIW